MLIMTLMEIVVMSTTIKCDGNKSSNDFNVGMAYLNNNKNRRIVVDSKNLIIAAGKDALEKELTEIFIEAYPGAVEEIDVNVPVPLVDELKITTFVYSDYAHDRVT